MTQNRAHLFSNRYDATEKPGFGFLRTLFIWHGSIFRLIWVHLIGFIIAFSSLNLLYRFVFIEDPKLRASFEMICIYCSRFSSKIPITFMIGFYVANVVSRYWDQFISLPWPDRIAFKLVSYIPGQDSYSRTLRRTIMRYINLSTVLVFRVVSPKVRARFPTYGSLVDAGLMLPGEDAKLAKIDGLTPHETSWAPVLWAVSLLQRERAEGRFKVEATIYANIVNSFEYLENCNRRIFNHGWVNFPFAYSQVITLTVYTYLFSNLFGHQFLEPKEGSGSDVLAKIGVSISNSKPYDVHTPVVYVPIFTLIEFIAYLGWVKVAETLLNPWGDDDEDFQVNYLIDRNFQTSLLIVDEAISDIELSPDAFDSTHVPGELPYNKTTGKSKVMGSQRDISDGTSCCSRFKGCFSVDRATMLTRLNQSTKEASISPDRESLEKLNQNPATEINLETFRSESKPNLTVIEPNRIDVLTLQQI